MKLLSALLFGVCMSVSASVLSQNAKVTVDLQNVTLTTVLEELGKQSKCDFFYNYALMQAKGVVSVKAENRELVKVLEELESGKRSIEKLTAADYLGKIAYYKGEVKRLRKEKGL